MTNGEKIQAVFPDIEMWGESKDTLDYSLGGMIHRVTKSWWYSEYKEPTTKNDCAEKNGCMSCSLDDGDDCCRKLYEESMQEPTAKNDLEVDCISRDEVCRYVAEFVNHEYSTREEEELIDNIITGIERMSSVTPQELRGDAINREAVLKLQYRIDDSETLSTRDVVNVEDIQDLPSVTPQEPRWIPISERLPKDLEPVNITWINHDPEPYYNDIKDKPFTATGVYFNGQWYWWSTLCTDILAEYSHNYDDIIDDAIEITAWMPLPTSYQGEKNDA